ncbi:hypothetical protein ACIQOW_08550 [Kitasatospora sp. NPDC091335]|uniref:hypothetical protein n=1 Tax=Kitasatospora sp. NPDC091335 TaxID=3364085 RepID=UPI00382F7F11
MRRRSGGAEIRQAMTAAGLTIAGLAAATRAADPTAVGISQSMVGFVTSRGRSAREECSRHVAELIATALGRPIGELFIDEVPMPAQSTSTRGSEKVPNAVEPLMTSVELLAYLRKSPSWLDREIKAGRITPIYAGRSRRFDRHQVLAELAVPAAA